MKISNTRVLVTGGSGFIPSHVTRRLVGDGADVAITTKYNSLIDNVRIDPNEGSPKLIAKRAEAARPGGSYEAPVAFLVARPLGR